MDAPEINPYTPPAAALHVTDDTDWVYPEASKGKRFLNFLLDRLAVFGFALLLGTALAFFEEMNWAYELLDGIEHLTPVQDFVLSCVIASFYYISMESLFGRTLGKLITGTKVLTNAGKRPSSLTVLGRTLARFVPFDGLSFFSSSGGWHDRWSGTQVVDVRAPKQAPVRASVMKYYR